MVNEADPSMRTAFDGRFTEVVDKELLASSGNWNGIPRRKAAWKSQLRVEFHGEDGKTRLRAPRGPGGWSVDFQSYSPPAAPEWRGSASARALAVLRDNTVIDAPA
jgi:hypothetical protein